MRKALVVLVPVLALASCGGEEPDRPAGPPATVAPRTATGPATVAADGGTAEGERACPPVDLGGAQATEILVTGAGCDRASAVVRGAAGAEGRAFVTDGVRCTPGDGTAVPTDYTCLGDGVDLSFLAGRA